MHASNVENEAAPIAINPRQNPRCDDDDIVEPFCMMDAAAAAPAPGDMGTLTPVPCR
jgi:hypothetical protein